MTVLAFLPVIYILVLFGSLLGICVILGVRVALRNRNVRKFVRSVNVRSNHAEQRGFLPETKIERDQKTPRTTAVELQKMHSLLRQAEKHLAREQYTDAEKLLIQALTAAPEATEARAELAKIYLLTDRESKAEAMYKELLKEGNDVAFHANLGLACYRQGKYEHACVSYGQALALDPKNPERSAALGRACIAARRFQDAVPLLEKSVERLARDTALMNLLAECYLQLGLQDKARETYRRIHKLRPYDDDVKEKLNALTAA